MPTTRYQYSYYSHFLKWGKGTEGEKQEKPIATIFYFLSLKASVLIQILSYSIAFLQEQAQQM